MVLDDIMRKLALTALGAILFFLVGFTTSVGLSKIYELNFAKSDQDINDFTRISVSILSFLTLIGGYAGYRVGRLLKAKDRKQK
jgi:hypothetical protein